MTTDSTALLAQTYADIWRDYNTALASKSTRQWDYVVITASNQAQAQAFSDQIEMRKSGRLLPTETQYLCIPDRGGARVGSGGATLSVLKEIVVREPTFRSFNDFRILIIHSGGDSKRVPQYSACGKLFSPVPRSGGDNCRCTLFDDFIALSGSFPERLPGGVVVGSGDVLLVFNPLQVEISGSAVAMAAKVSLDIGVEHGVFVAEESGEIVEFLHKQDAKVLRGKGAVDGEGKVDLDIGFVWLSGSVTDALWNVISVGSHFSEAKYDFFVNDSARLSFYGDFLFPLASHSTLEQYLNETPEYKINEELIECRRQLWPLLHEFKMRIQRLSPAIYIHFGTTAELRSLMTDDLSTFSCLGWKRNVLSNVGSEVGFTAINSIVSRDASVGEGTYLEDTYLDCGCRIGERCVISNLYLHEGIEIVDWTVVHVMPVERTKYCCRIYGVHDNAKKCELFGENLSELIEFYGIRKENIFEGEEYYLWNCRLYPIVERVEEVAEVINFIQGFVSRRSTMSDISSWLEKERNSLSFSKADIDRILAWQNTVQRDLQARSQSGSDDA
jgi:fucokinase